MNTLFKGIWKKFLPAFLRKIVIIRCDYMYAKDRLQSLKLKTEDRFATY